MRQIHAIVQLTVKAAFRFRLVMLMAALLLGAVVLLPLIIKDDGTAQGFTQIMLTYTLWAITTLLGFSTLWMACGTLAREVEECQMQMLAVKPIARWQIWVGKWLGILLFDLMLLALAGAAVFVLLQWRARGLSAAERAILQNKILLARGAVRETPPNLGPVIEQEFQERVKNSPVIGFDRNLLRKQIAEKVKAEYQLVAPGYGRRWEIDLHEVKDYLRNRPLYLRTKFRTAQDQRPSGLFGPPTFWTFWQVGPAESPRVWRQEMNLAADTFHEFAIPPNLLDDQGKLTIDFINPPDNKSSLLFQFEDGLEVLYWEGGFGLNFVRGLGVIFCWLAVLAALGLACASFLSFPVASFLALGILIVGLSRGTLSQVVEQGAVWGVNPNTGLVDEPRLVDRVMVPLFGALLKVVNLVQGFSPIDSLSSGRSITWGQLGQAFLQIVVVMGGLFGGVGILCFTKRELATAQGSQ
jgi:hypothetical protein